MIERIAERGFGVWEDFLTPAELATINQAFGRWLSEGRFAPAKIGQGDNRRQQESVRGDETWWFDPMGPPAELAPVLARIEALKTELNRALFLGLKDWEAHLARYPAGRGYQKHLDRHLGVSHRKLSLVLYLNENWAADAGGELVLFDKNGNELQRVAPVGGRLVAFLSEDFPHEVRPANRERRSLTGWFLDASRGVV